MEEKFKKIIDSKWTHSIESDKIQIYYNVNSGIYLLEYDEMTTPLRELLVLFNQITYNALSSFPTKEDIKPDVMSKTIGELTKEELIELISSITNNKVKSDLSKPDLIKPSERTLDIVRKYENKLVSNMTLEDLDNATINLKEYIDGSSRESLQSILDDINRGNIEVASNSTVLSVLKSAVTSYIGYIDAVSAVNPNLKVDVFGASVLPKDVEVKSVTNSNGDYNIPVAFSGAKTTIAEPVERGVSPFSGLVRKWKD